MEVPISDIVITGWNPRKSFDEKALEELAASIKEHGILEPLVVRQVNGSYELVAGERRLRAAKLAGLDKVPVVVKDLTDQEVREIMLLENLQRQDLNPIEEALALKALLEESNITQAELGKRLGKSQAWVANRLRLLEAPEPLKDLVISREISPKHVLTLLPYVNYAIFKERILPAIKDRLEKGERISVRGLEELIREVIIRDWQGVVVLNLNDFPFDLEKYREYFDFTGCEGCKHAYSVKLEWKDEEDLYCLNRPCWKDKINRAKHKYEKSLSKKLKGGKVDTSHLSYGDYHRLSWANFDTAECEGCEHCKLDLGDNKICLNPECYEDKERAWKREQTRIKAEKTKQTFKYLDEKLSKFSELGENELRFILRALANLMWQESVKKGLKPWGGIDSVPAEDLGRAMLRLIITDRMVTSRYENPSPEMVDSILKELQEVEA